MNRQLLLQNVRGVLIRLEETILFALIERAQFRRNAWAYQPGALGEIIGGDSLVGYLLHKTEKLHAKMRRYTSPDEHPFYRDLPKPILPPLRFDENPLHPNSVNLNDTIRRTYEEQIVPLITLPGDDQQYGSTAVCDVACLQALSRRIHYGKFVAETKYQADPDGFRPLIRAQNHAKLLERITDDAVEKQVLDRVAAKVQRYCAGLDPNDGSVRIEPETAVRIFREWVIPLSKEVQVLYLLQRSLSTSSPLTPPGSGAAP